MAQHFSEEKENRDAERPSREERLENTNRQLRRIGRLYARWSIPLIIAGLIFVAVILWFR